MDIFKLKDAIVKTNNHSKMPIIDNANLNLSCANTCPVRCSSGCDLNCSGQCSDRCTSSGCSSVCMAAGENVRETRR